MKQVAEILGVELGEKFIIENTESKMRVVLDADGLHISVGGFLGTPKPDMLQNLLCGLYEVKKLPWEPKENERYYCPSITYNCVTDFDWGNLTLDFAMKALGMIYRTREEAEAHFSEDYERLTGKKLEG